jgi:hypothetical protein
MPGTTTKKERTKLIANIHKFTIKTRKMALVAATVLPDNKFCLWPILCEKTPKATTSG